VVGGLPCSIITKQGVLVFRHEFPPLFESIPPYNYGRPLQGASCFFQITIIIRRWEILSISRNCPTLSLGDMAGGRPPPALVAYSANETSPLSPSKEQTPSRSCFSFFSLLTWWSWGLGRCGLCGAFGDVEEDDKDNDERVSNQHGSTFKLAFVESTNNEKGSNSQPMLYQDTDSDDDDDDDDVVRRFGGGNSFLDRYW